MLIIDDAIRPAFAVSTGNRVRFYREFLDLGRFPGERQKRQNNGSGPGNDQREFDYKVNDLGVAHSGRNHYTLGWVAAIVPSGKKENVRVATNCLSHLFLP
jgi:hypothetical protein